MSGDVSLCFAMLTCLHSLSVRVLLTQLLFHRTFSNIGKFDGIDVDLQILAILAVVEDHCGCAAVCGCVEGKGNR